jgi:hypothetical protein
MWYHHGNSNNNIFPISREWQVITRLLLRSYSIAMLYEPIILVRLIGYKHIYASGFHSIPSNLMHKHKMKCKIIGVMHRGLPGHDLPKLAFYHGDTIIKALSFLLPPYDSTIHHRSYYDIRGCNTKT